MMIFLLILKIIGIILCVILGIVAVILFAPVFYEADANIDEMDYKVRIHWLAKLIRFEFRWKGKAHAMLKILWFVIDFTDPEAVAARKAKKKVKSRKKLIKQQKKEAKKREKQTRQRQKEAQQEQADREARAQQREAFRKQQEEAEIKKVEAVNADESLGKEASVAQDKEAYEKAEQAESENIRQEAAEAEKAEANESKASVLEKLKSAHGTAESILDKVKTALAVIRYLREQELISAVWVKLQVFLLRIRPRKLSGHLKFGLSNPADTGQILGVIAMVPLFYQTELQIEPDFEAEDNYVQGQVYVKGHICCIHLVILIIRLLRDEKIRTLIRTIREKN
ncbi:DUF2953 domain-containing protein [uncultured Eubacterium sp.]|uniref:DUF2953 domain-containing protein n=1 Tax=uncultured Eubacterium sp. TaxID=165185 RepID=UPI0015B23BFB|nr:DUF2953 domain-containing protein [uncultured Eubacterium sp.]